MGPVFVLQHAYEGPYGADDVKLIGVYSSQTEAENAVERLKQQPGFKDHPDEFHIDRYEIDQDHWTEGFVRWDDE